MQVYLVKKQCVSLNDTYITKYGPDLSVSFTQDIMTVGVSGRVVATNSTCPTT